MLDLPHSLVKTYHFLEQCRDTMRFPLIGQNGSIFTGNLRLFWFYFYRMIMGNA
jgi:hypothetical protein